MDKFMVRHGDLLVEKLNTTIPKGAKKRSSNIILTGANGHHHFLNNGIILDNDGTAYLKVARDKVATLTHDEHNLIELPSGSYIVIRQREFDPYLDAIRMVED